jgi:hypothetical protein
MTNPNSRLLQSSSIACLGIVVMVGGCAKEEPPVQTIAPVARNTTPPPPPPPRVTPVSDLMAEYRIDERVILPEDKAPDNDPDRIAVLQFYDSFARGDYRSLGNMMSMPDRLELDALVETGAWDDTIEQIEMIEVQTGTSALGQCALAVFSVGMDFQPQLWYYEGSGEDYAFEAAPSPPGILDRLHGNDWIKAWHEVLEAEMAMAELADDNAELPQLNLSGGDGAGASSQPAASPSSPGNPFSPGATPPNRGRRRPSGNPRRAPGPGGGGGGRPGGN